MGITENEEGGVLLSPESKPVMVETEFRYEEVNNENNESGGAEPGFPSSVKFIMANEICERFSYYGLRAILSFYITEQLLMSESAAKEIVHSFTMGAYGITLLGGFLADAVFGKFKTILYFSLIYCVGGAVLAGTAVKSLAVIHQTIGMAFGLFFIALGTGIKPVISTFLGDQFTSGQSHMLERVFRMFYFCINFGSFFSTLLTPIIRTQLGYSAAFGLPAILLLISTSIYISGRKTYRTHAPQNSVLTDSVKLIFHSTVALYKYGRQMIPTGKNFLYLSEGVFPQTLIKDVTQASKVLLVFVPMPFVWALYDQHSTTWIFQAKDMDRHIGKLELDADQIPALAPALVLVLVPIFDLIIYPLFNKFKPLTPLTRMAAGMFLTAAAFAVAGLLQMLMEEKGEGKVHVVLQVPQYVILVSGEVMVSITGLEFAYTQAPTSMKGLIMSGWLITVALGNLLVVVLAGVVQGSVVQFFLYSGLMIGAMIIFIVIAVFYKNAPNN